MAKKEGKPNGVKRLFYRLNKVPSWLAILMWLTALIITPFTIVTTFLDKGQVVLTIGAFVFSGFALIYMVFATALLVRRWGKRLVRAVDKYKFTRNLHKSYEFRTLFFSGCSFVFNVGYTVFICVLAVMYQSSWYGILAMYYILLTMARGGVLVENQKNVKRYGDDVKRLQIENIGGYRYCGIMILALTLALSVAVVQMAVEGAIFNIPYGLIYAFGAVAFFRVVLAIRNLVKARRYDDLIVHAVRNVNIITALLSLLSFQTAFFAAFPPEWNPALFNAISGTIVCLVGVSLGIYMVSFSGYLRKKLLSNVKADNVDEMEEELLRKLTVSDQLQVGRYALSIENIPPISETNTDEAVDETNDKNDDNTKKNCE